MSWLPSPAVSLCPCMQSLISPQAPATCISKTHLDDQRIKCVLYILLVVQTYPNPHTVNDFLSQRCEKQTVPANSSSTLPCYLQQNCNSATNSHTNCAMCLFSGTLSDTEDNALQSGKSKKKAGIILNSNMWKKGHDLRLKWDEEDGWNHSFLTLADELEGIFDEKELFQFYNGRDGDLCLLCEVWEVPSTPPPKKGHFFIRCDCSVPLLILKDDGAVFSPVSPLDSVVFTVPQTDSCKSIKSSERSTGFGCDNDLQKTTNGERMSLTSTRACTWAHTGAPSTPLHSKLAEQSPHSYQPWPSPPILCQLQIEVAAPGIMQCRGGGGAVGWHCHSFLLEARIPSLSSRSQWVATRNGPARVVIE